MKTRFTIKIIAIFTLLILTGCDDIVDCLDNIRPRLNTKELSEGTSFYNYSDEISFSMENASTDDYFIDDAEIDGRLPPGISYVISDYNKIRFQGKPTEKGAFTFTVKITVATHIYDEDGNDSLCGNRASNTYMIVIN